MRATNTIAPMAPVRSADPGQAALRCAGSAALALAACIAAADGDPANAAAPGAQPDALAWLTGHWCGSGEQPGERVEEHWLAPHGGVQLGVARTLRGARTAGFEFLRIETRDGVPHYVAQPGGAPPTAFRLVASGEGRARFENPAHDFPQAIEYRRTPRGLQARIEGPGEGGGVQGIDFSFAACAPSGSGH